MTQRRDCGGIKAEFDRNVDYVHHVIKEGLPDAIVDLGDFTDGSGDTDHINVIVVSDAFKDKSIIEQHRMVMALLDEGMRTRIHAVKIKTMTHDKYKQLNN